MDRVLGTYGLRICELLSKLLKGGLYRDCIGDYYRGFKGDTRSLDYSSCILRFFYGALRLPQNRNWFISAVMGRLQVPMDPSAVVGRRP